MQLLQTLTPPQYILLYFAIGFIIWYLAYGFEMWINSGSLGRGKYWVFKCFKQDLQWFLPGGLQKRTDYIREKVKPHPNVSGYIGGYSHEQIREQNLYEYVAKKSLGNGFHFWGVNVILMFFLWPLFLIFLALAVALGSIISMLASLTEALRG